MLWACSEGILFGSFRGEGSYGGQVGFELGGEVVAGLQPRWVDPGELRAAVGGLSDEDLEWEVERGGGRGEHQGCAGFGVSEDEELRRRHGEAGGERFAGVVDEAEELDAFFFEEGFEAGDGFVDGMVSGEGDDALHGVPPERRATAGR
jgi:hypothetical protein